MLPTEIGALMRYADDLLDCRLLSAASFVMLNRLVFRYRARGAPAACVGLDELAGCGFAKGTVISALEGLERAHVILKEKCGEVINGQWRQTANRYWLRTADQAKAAAIAEAAEVADEVEIAFVTPSESNSWTANGVFLEEKESKEESLYILPVDNGDNASVEDVCRSQGDEAPDRQERCGDIARGQGRPTIDCLGRGIPRQLGGDASPLAWGDGVVREAGDGPVEDRGQGSRADDGDGRGGGGDDAASACPDSCRATGNPDWEAAETRAAGTAPCPAGPERGRTGGYLGAGPIGAGPTGGPPGGGRGAYAPITSP